MKKGISIIAALVTIIVGGIAIYQFYHSLNEPNQSTTTTPVYQPSLMERLQGSYTLQSWTPVHGRMELGIDVTNGDLDIKPDGFFDWSVIVKQKNTSNPGKVRMTARGKFSKSAMEVDGISGSKYNNTTYLDNRWMQVDPVIGLAIRGWQAGKKGDPFQISIDERSTGEVFIDMKNSRGIYTWKK